MYEEENIYDLIKFEKRNGRKRLFKSKYPPNLCPTGSTFGLCNNSAFVFFLQIFYNMPKDYQHEW